MTSRIRHALARQDGFTMIAVLGILAAAMAFSVAAFAAAGGDVHLSRNDQDQKRAYAAAEAGVQDYFFHLTQDNSYWAKCTSQTPAHPALNLAGASPLKKRQVPGSNASYSIELLPAAGQTQYTQCDPNNAEASMIISTGPQSGTFSIRSTGYSNGVSRKIIATFRRRSFVDYLWFTDLETSDPAWYTMNTGGNPTQSGVYVKGKNGAYTFTVAANSDVLTWAATKCATYYRNGRSSQSYPDAPNNAWQQQINGVWSPDPPNTSTDINCSEIQFVTGDSVNGPMHTNDELLACGSPVWGRPGKNDEIEVSGSGYRSAGGSNCSGTPTINGTWKPKAAVLTPPPSDTTLKQIADPAYVFKGTTYISLNGGSMTVKNANLSGGQQTLAFPSNGVVYVDYDPAVVCPQTSYQALNPYGDAVSCADVYVNGTYSNDLTIASAKDIVVDGNIARASNTDAMLGLIANNFVRIKHTVVRSQTDPTSCSNDATTPTNISIDAAILALNHSFTVDNYYCGAPLGKLTVNGAIAQKFRGPVGRGGGASSITNGYLKNYTYDDRLRVREPPHFINPVLASWRLRRYAEQVG